MIRFKALTMASSLAYQCNLSLHPSPSFGFQAARGQQRWHGPVVDRSPAGQEHPPFAALDSIRSHVQGLLMGHFSLYYIFTDALIPTFVLQFGAVRCQIDLSSCCSLLLTFAFEIALLLFECNQAHFASVILLSDKGPGLLQRHPHRV